MKARIAKWLTAQVLAASKYTYKSGYTASFWSGLGFGLRFGLWSGLGLAFGFGSGFGFTVYALRPRTALQPRLARRMAFSRASTLPPPLTGSASGAMRKGMPSRAVSRAAAPTFRQVPRSAQQGPG